MAAYGRLRRSKFSDNKDYDAKAHALMEANNLYLTESPRAVLKMVVAADYMLNPPKEIAIAGTEGSEDVRVLLSAVFDHFIPNKIVAFLDPSQENAASIEQAIPLLESKTLIQDQAAAYVCKDFACKLPVTTSAELLEQLGVS